ncbi:hypothetical protein [Haloarchaeobius amylolyticus]|uniref:hypothetical protein n=1 Tax=Haloarchaeobius amylolyticus TaxID=1198296 RepID=UPI0022700393|nr:hypothetical protein [Haloarchaeobius amylolyticus]
MTTTTDDETAAGVPSVTTRIDESASEHIVTMLHDALENHDRVDDDPHVLAVGIGHEADDEASGESLNDLAQETLFELKSNGIEVMGLSSGAAVDTLGEQADTPTDCYDAIVLFRPLHEVDDLGVDDLLSEEAPFQLFVDVTGTVEPASVVEHGAVSVTYRGL